MKHKYCGIVCEKANNMDLVIFAKKKNDGKIWRECSQDTIPSDSGYCEYFACLPKHKEAVLHSLNGGESVSDNGNGDWCLSSTELWHKDWWYMLKSYESKIKPKKEKRLISVYKDSVAFVDPDLEYPACVQFIEIEVEV